jgi:hypothetical protein
MLRLSTVASTALEDRLGAATGELEESQQARSAALESAIQLVHGDIHGLARSLLDMAMSMQRLEAKLDRLSEGAGRDGDLRAAARQKGALSSDGGWRAAEWKDSERAPAPGVERETGGGQARVTSRTESQSGAVAAAQDHVQALVSTPNLKAKARALVSGSAAADVEADLWRSGGNREGESSAESDKPPGPGGLLELDSRIGSMDRKLDRIAAAVGVKSVGNDGDDEADRKRLKEKLKVAIELDRRSRIRTIVSQSEVWLEYMFGICKPDQRIGKRGSR